MIRAWVCMLSFKEALSSIRIQTEEGGRVVKRAQRNSGGHFRRTIRLTGTIRSCLTIISHEVSSFKDAIETQLYPWGRVAWRNLNYIPMRYANGSTATARTVTE